MMAGAEPLRLLIAAAGRNAARAKGEFAVIAAVSDELLAALGEPLLALDFTEHRWVGERREEAYSDWLTWVLAQADAAEVLLILGAADPELSAACGNSIVSIARESFAAEGHEGSTGRPDLRVSLG
jgi:hypothetical protein